jgi:hypothetical protein
VHRTYVRLPEEGVRPLSEVEEHVRPVVVQDAAATYSSSVQRLLLKAGVKEGAVLARFAVAQVSYGQD